MPTAVYDPATGALLGVKLMLFEIYVDVGHLTGAQNNAIWTDLQSGTPPKMALDEGPNAAAIFALAWSAITLINITAAERTEAKQRIIAMYVQDNVQYLIRPPFDSTINVPGYE